MKSCFNNGKDREGWEEAERSEKEEEEFEEENNSDRRNVEARRSGELRNLLVLSGWEVRQILLKVKGLPDEGN